MNIILIVILGLVVGSFLNVCIYRMPREMSIVKPRSKCTNCDHQITAWENIPIFSYLLLRGKCSNCKTKISTRYPLIELLTALVYCIVYLYYGFSIETILLLILFSIIIVLTFIDIDFQLLPNNLLILSLIPIILFIILQYPNNLIDHIVGGITMLSIFLFIGYLGKLVYKVDSMGMGDVKYAAVIGIFLGWKLGLLSFVISFFSAALFIAAMSIIKKFNRKQRLAFGPFLSIGIFVSFFWGNEIINWYMGFYG